MVVCQREKEDRERFHGSRVADIMTQGYGQLDLRFLQNVQIKVLDRSWERMPEQRWIHPQDYVGDSEEEEA